MDQNELKTLTEAYLAQEEHPDFKSEAQRLWAAGDWSELNERFYTSLSFGTGGLRGTIGAGTNRMNPTVVRRATQGLADYVNAAVTGSKSAAIAYDSRRYSDLFALEAALVLAANGIKTYLFKALRPTPELSFAVRHLGCTTGIVVTASHNPPEYNGYKVYWADGAQVVPPHDKGIIEKVRAVGAFKTLSKEEALAKGLLVFIDKEVDEPYKAMVRAQALRPELFKTQKLKVVYTPLHGTGGQLVPQLCSELGLEVIPVPEQSKPDGNFPTVESPNPEEASALKMALDLARREKADLVIGTDPDADRIGIAVPDAQGEWVLLNGNQLGALLTEYAFSTLKAQGRLPKRPAFVNTIVTTDLHLAIAKAYGAETFKVLTGFKYIGALIREWENTPDAPTYVIGGEESYGFLFGDKVRDKDAVSSATLTVELALWLKSQGRTVLEELNRLYAAYGYYKEILLSKTFKGQAGLQKMKDFMQGLRTQAPSTLGGLKVRELIDYLPGKTLPSSDVVQFALEDGSLVTVRPSGTEPKVKFYASCRAPEGLALAAAEAQVAAKLKAIEDDLDGMLN